MSEEVPYQRQPQVHQAEQEIENARALGLDDRVAAAEKTLAALREAGEKRQRAAAKTDDDTDTDRNVVPEGRSSRQAQQVTTDKK